LLGNISFFINYLQQFYQQGALFDLILKILTILPTFICLG